ncbi:MAG TPA: MFS transporter [Oscillatoriaceae cyanobacterium M33_DOE_052]|uniref:MFS transporter n=1 Tax=Planktothricoides sp. SpSt-374 TaxID=2282167 RepID=A0A7C3VQT2_9CYAN|nr:MFS transporter [Oscillatoriaceae cyanobacterium M33_DOE_052]
MRLSDSTTSSKITSPPGKSASNSFPSHQHHHSDQFSKIAPPATDWPGKHQPPNPELNPPPPEPEEQGFGPVLKNPNFLALWSGQVFSQLADKVYLVLMIALIASRFEDSNQTISGWVSAITIAFTIPAVLFGSLAGAFADRWPKKSVLVFTNILRGILVLTIPLLLWISEGWRFAALPLGFCLMLAVTFLVSTLTQFFAPAEQAAIPLVVERRHLLAANSLYTTTMMASVIVGFAVGEPVLKLADSLLGQNGTESIGKELVVGSSYCIAGLLLMLLKIRENNNSQPESAHVFEDIRDGLRYLSQNHRVRAAMSQLIVLFCVFAALAVLAVRVAQVMPALRADQFGFLLAAAGVGMGVGAAILGHFGSSFSHRRLSTFGSVGMAGSLGGMALFTEQLWPSLCLIAMLGFFASMVGVPMQTAIQAETPEDMRGKVFGLQNNAINIALSLPLAIASVAETFLGLQVVFFLLAAIVIAGNAISWYISGTKPS